MSKKRRRSNNRPNNNNNNSKETYIEKVAKAAEEADEQLQEALKAEEAESAEEAAEAEVSDDEVVLEDGKNSAKEAKKAVSSEKSGGKKASGQNSKSDDEADQKTDDADTDTKKREKSADKSSKNMKNTGKDADKNDGKADAAEADPDDDASENDHKPEIDNNEADVEDRDDDSDQDDSERAKSGDRGSGDDEEGPSQDDTAEDRASRDDAADHDTAEDGRSRDEDAEDDEAAEEEEAQNKEFSAASAKLREDYDFEDSPEYRKVMRHKRRVRNQVIAYIVTVLLLAGIGVGVYFGAQYLTKIVKADQAKKAEEKAAEEAAAAAEEAEKQEIVVTAPETVEEEEDTYEEEIVEMTPEDYLNEMVTSTITQMPLEDKVAQLFVITPEALTGVGAATKAGDGTKEALSKYAVGGLIYDKRNIEDEDQLVELIDNTRNMSKYDLFIGVKEPGGDTSTLAGSKLGDVPPVDAPSVVAETGDPTNAYNAGVTISSYLSYYGINLDLAPNASITTDEKSISASSSYGSDEAVAYEMISKMIEGLQTGSVRACLTDFPGTGNITEDTASGRVESEITSDDISAQIAPYITGVMAGAQFIQVNNVTYMTVDEDAMPASMSKNIVDTYLRGNMGYDGVVISGPLNEKAVTEYYTSDQAALYAYAAGVDLIYMPEDFEMAYNAVLDAVKDGTIPESRIDKSLERIFKVKLAGYVE